jgi:hypothetical protein
MKRSRKSPESTPALDQLQPTQGGPIEGQAAPAQAEGADAVERLAKEIKEYREALSRKMAELRTLKGQTSGESDVVRRVVGLLSRTEGATKAQIIEETGAKKGYVDALLNRILPEKGYTMTAITVSGERTKTYRIP